MAEHVEEALESNEIIEDLSNTMRAIERRTGLTTPLLIGLLVFVVVFNIALFCFLSR